MSQSALLAAAVALLREAGEASGSDRQMDDVIAIASNQELDHDYLSRWAETLGLSAQLNAVFAAVQRGEA